MCKPACVKSNLTEFSTHYVAITAHTFVNLTYIVSSICRQCRRVNPGAPGLVIGVISDQVETDFLAKPLLEV